MEDLTVGERYAKLMKNGIHQVGGSTDIDGATDGYDLLADEVGEEEALAILRNAIYHFVLSQMQVGLYENSYVSLAHAQETVWNTETDAYATELQKKSVVMLKNSGNAIAQSDGSKKTVYVPYVFSKGAAARGSGEATPPGWNPVLDLDVAAEYFNVVTDTVGEPSGKDEDGNAVYTENDIVRASASELAACDMALVGISSPLTLSSKSNDGAWLPASLQFEAYTAKTARQESIGGFITTETMNDGYGMVSQDVKENRSYYGNSVGQASNYSEYELLQYVADAVPDGCDVILFVKGRNPMIFSEVEPLADAILLYWGQSTGSGWFKPEVLMSIAAGETEPSGLLNMQMPANMEAVEAQYEDVPRDMECYVDADGNTYDFTFGLNWSGKIDDERVKTYNVPALTECENLDFYYANQA